MERFVRTAMLIGDNALSRLQKSNVAVFGVGGVGGYAVEALVRTGVGNLTVIDNDVVTLSNINRQIIATTSTLGQLKTQVAKQRAIDINPNVNVSAINTFYLPENAHQIDLSQFDYIIDAMDTVSAKLEVIKRAKALNVPIISCMGTGGKTDATKLVITDVYATQNCPLAKVMRKELKALNVSSLDVVFCTQQPVTPVGTNQQGGMLKQSGRQAPPSTIFVPAMAGLMLANHVVQKLISE